MVRVIKSRYVIIILITIIILSSLLFAIIKNQDKFVVDAFSYGSGTIDDPYKIYYESQIVSIYQKIALDPTSLEDKHFSLMRDIKMNTSPRSSQSGFRGVFNGNGHTITTNYYFLEGIGKRGVLKNLNLKIQKTLIAKSNFSFYGICKSIYNSALIDNCYVYYDIDFDWSYIDNEKPSSLERPSFTFCGITRHNDGTINNCYVGGNIGFLDYRARLAKISNYGICMDGEGTVENTICNLNFNYKTGIRTMCFYNICDCANNNCKFTGSFNYTLDYNLSYYYANASQRLNSLKICLYQENSTNAYFGGIICIDYKEHNNDKESIIISKSNNYIDEGKIIETNKKDIDS